MKFLRITTVKNITVLINMDNIVSIFKDEHIKIYTITGLIYETEETLEEIIDRITELGGILLIR